MWYDGYERSRKRSQTSFVIPAWRKGDRVLHKPSGFYGELVDMATAGGELWKMRVEAVFPPPGVSGAAIMAELRPKGYSLQVHACDLELRT